MTGNSGVKNRVIIKGCSYNMTSYNSMHFTKDTINNCNLNAENFGCTRT